MLWASFVVCGFRFPLRAPLPRCRLTRARRPLARALEQALRTEHPMAKRRPTIAAWLRDLAVAHASEVLEVEVTPSGLRQAADRIPDWKRWKLSRAVKRAAVRLRRGATGSRPRSWAEPGDDRAGTWTGSGL